MPVLPSASSVVDFLKGKGFKPSAGEKIPLFEQRKQIYNTLGLNTQLGEFRGSAVQNPAIIQALSKAEKSSGVSLNPANLQSILTIARGGAPAQTKYLGGSATFDESTGTERRPTAPTDPDQGVTRYPGGSAEFDESTGTYKRPIGNDLVQQALPDQPTPLPEEPTQIPLEVQQKALDIIKQPSEQDIAQQALQRVIGSPTFPLEQERVEAEKGIVQAQAKQSTEDLISTMASRGFSILGKTSQGVQQIEADKLSKLLNIDRGFALLITKGLETAAQQVAKEAQKGSSDAIEALGKLGYGINPLTGGIEPTLEAKRVKGQERQQALQAQQFQQQEARREAQQTQQAQQFQQSQERLERGAEAQQQRFEATQALAEARLAVTTAQNQAQMQIAQRRLELAEQNAMRLGAGVAGVSQQLKQLELQQKLAELIPSEGQIINKKSGFPAKVPSEFADSIAGGQTMLNRDIPSIEDLVGKVDTGPVRAPIIRTSQSLGTSKQSENQLTALIADLNSKLLNLRSGAAVTPQEYERLQQLLPRLENQPKVNKDNLKTFSKNLEASLKNKLDVRGLEIAVGLKKGKPPLNSFIKK